MQTFIGSAVKLYNELSRQLGNRDQTPLKANGGQWPNHDRLVVKGNTYIIRENDGSITVRYHYTNIVNVTRDGVITLNSGGWHTYSTKQRMNEVAKLGQDGYEQAFSVHQSNHKWFVNGDIPFTDGMKLIP